MTGGSSISTLTRRQPSPVKSEEVSEGSSRSEADLEDFEDIEASEYSSVIAGAETVSEKYVRWYWTTFKVHSACLSIVTTAVFIVLIVANLSVYMRPDASLVNRAATQNKRNVSALVPIWGPIHRHSLGNWTITFLRHLMWIAVLYTVVGVVAFVTYQSTFRQRERTVVFLLALFITLLLFTIFAEIYAVLSMFIYDNIAYAHTRQEIKEKIRSEYQLVGENSFTVSLNLHMIQGDCCGIHGPGDFSYINTTLVLTGNILHTYKYAPKPNDDTFYWPKEGMSTHLNIPPVCCKEKYFRDGTLEYQFNRQIQCALNRYDRSSANLIGCGKVYYQRRIEQYGALVILSLVISMYFKVVVGGFCLLRLLQYFDKSTYRSRV